MIEAPSTQEKYQAATQSSSLRVEAEKAGDADYLIAAGWCKSKFGAALMRLQAEWDGAERWGVKIPVKPTKRAIMTEAQVTYERKTSKVKWQERPAVIRKITSESMDAARQALERRYEAEMKKAFAALKTLPEAVRDLKIKLALDGLDIELAAPLLLYWLDSRCKVCHGTGFQPNSERACGKCREHPGLAPVPGGSIGKGVLVFMQNCAARASGETRSYCRH